jgi:hypothetical protein
MNTSINIEPIHGRIWTVYPSFGADGTITKIRMVWGCAERSFAPGEENDSITKVGLAAAQALAAVCLPNDDEFALIEQFT